MDSSTDRSFGHRSSRVGLTLLEVVLAVAILAVAMALIGNMIRMGARRANASHTEARAQLLCQNKLAEIVAGLQPPTAVNGATFELDPQWRYSVSLDSTGREKLLALRVVVWLEDGPRNNLPSFALTRWIVDPEVVNDPANAPNPTPDSSSETSSESDES